METKIDRLGLCPRCKANWAGPDVYKALNSLSVFVNTTDKELKAVAANYGWTEEDNKRFTRVIIHELDSEHIYFQCPEVRCGTVYDSQTGEEFGSMSDVKRKGFVLIIDMEAVPKLDIEELKAEMMANSLEVIDAAKCLTPLITGTAGEMDTKGLEEIFHDPTGDLIPKGEIDEEKFLKVMEQVGIISVEETVKAEYPFTINESFKTDKPEEDGKENTTGSISNFSKLLRRIKK